MSATQIISITVGCLALVGLIGIISGAMSRRPTARRRGVRIGGGAMTAAGLLLMLTSFLGLSDPEEIMYGFLLMVFGTGVSVAPTFTKPNKDHSDLAR